jgi:hypothetical protein
MSHGGGGEGDEDGTWPTNAGRFKPHRSTLNSFANSHFIPNQINGTIWRRESDNNTIKLVSKLSFLIIPWSHLSLLKSNLPLTRLI